MERRAVTLHNTKLSLTKTCILWASHDLFNMICSLALLMVHLEIKQIRKASLYIAPCKIFSFPGRWSTIVRIILCIQCFSLYWRLVLSTDYLTIMVHQNQYITVVRTKWWFYKRRFWVISVGPFAMKFTHNEKDNRYFQIMPKTEKWQKCRYKVLFRKQRYALIV